MKTIHEIEHLLSLNKEMLARYEKNLAADPQSLFNQVQVENARNEILTLTENLKAITAQVIEEKKDRGVEIIELRLIGKDARNGTLPLDILGKIALAFSDSIHHTSRKIQYGDNKGSLKQIKQTLDLRLARVATGSTRLYISGQTNPDLFGRSLMEESLTGTFNLLNANDEDQFIEAASYCGFSGADKLNHFLSSLSTHDLELEMNWDSPQLENLQWYGKKERILQISNTLKRFEKSKPAEVPFKGVMIATSLKGNFEIQLEDKRVIKGTYPKTLFSTIKNITIGDDCHGIFEEIRITNPVTTKEKLTYSIKQIAPLS